MKMITLTLIICLFCASLTAPPSSDMVILAPEQIKPYERIWNATCYVESRFDSMAIGDKHLKDKSYGIVQIRQTRLDDYFRQTGIRYSVKDMFSPGKSKEVFLFYASGSDMEVISRMWNGGSRGMQKESTKKYYLKIKQAMLSL